MTTSIWKAKASNNHYPPLQGQLEVDIAIVGGGITGITSAYLLAKSGVRVAVLESMQVGGGTTAGSTGNLYTMVDNRLHHIQAKFDKQTARTVAESRTAAVDFIEQLTLDYDIECSFKRQPWILYTESGEEKKIIQKTKEALRDFGLEVEELQSLPLPFQIDSAIKVENQAQFNPAAFVSGLAQNIEKDRCKIFENTPVHHIEKGSPHILHTPNGKVTAGKVILATHSPKGVYALHSKLFPHREYALAAKLKSGEYPEGIFWSTDSKTHPSLRSYDTADGKYLITVGYHHKVGQEDPQKDYFGDLEKNLRRIYDVEEVVYKWSAQHYKPADGLPYIGESSDDNIYVATGFSTDGLTYGVVSAMIFKDLLTGKENKWAKTYDAKRFTPLKSAKPFIKENLNVLKEYLKDIPGKAEAGMFSEVKKGEGKIIEMKDEKWAVHRDEDGKLCAASAVCTHMDCIVNWNNEEKTWDCPCHGSRFRPTGEVIEGPAFSPLDKRQINPEK
ncbi:FAD-dependent oxidoreductase [Antarcticibacterium flavum]|uniref:FAD-dependent oxidoreductase n=1 Tax=Antarcticibacterium flavum TaxID=2058175 RepID=A0A5B7WZJ2_9FLAO|nr:MULTISPECIES: FAD-dependent oxidoreductase [Antarcticibacterium]MCM4158624.1 (2Fe-2S)-binding protein [Antarcticibacterium sp. W02-3]QCY68479.1 FAD-dependent oxidoreductase [Antarcticibacterium flavum]